MMCSYTDLYGKLEHNVDTVSPLTMQALLAGGTGFGV
jgi:hypothetical protein